MNQLEMGAKIQYFYDQLLEARDACERNNANSEEENNSDYDYIKLCELMMDELTEEFSFIVQAK